MSTIELKNTKELKQTREKIGVPAVTVLEKEIENISKEDSVELLCIAAKLNRLWNFLDAPFVP